MRGMYLRGLDDDSQGVGEGESGKKEGCCDELHDVAGCGEALVRRYL